MKKHYFLLLVAGFLSCMSVDAQNAGTVLHAGLVKSAPFVSELGSASTALPDSVLSFWNLGSENEMKFKTVYKRASNGLVEECKQWDWDNKNQAWTLEMTESYTHDGQGRITRYEQSFIGFSKTTEIFTWNDNIGIGKSITESGDYGGIFMEIDDKGRTVKRWYSTGKKENEDYDSWIYQTKRKYEYDEQGRQTKFVQEDYDNDGKFESSFIQEIEYKDDEKVIIISNKSSDGTTTKTEYTDKKKGSNPVAWISYGDDGTPSIDYEYYPDNGETSGGGFMRSDNNDPVGSENTGIFDIVIDLPISSIKKASFTMDLPEGFTLDIERMTLVDDFGKFGLSAAKQDNNKWSIVIDDRRSLRAVSDNASDALLVHVICLVDEGVAQGSYDVNVYDLRFTTPMGNMIYGIETLVVPVVLERSATGMENIQVPKVLLSYSGQVLTVDSPVSEMVCVYDLASRLVYQCVKPAGKTTIVLPGLSGVMIVKGESNWVEKIQVQ